VAGKATRGQGNRRGPGSTGSFSSKAGPSRKPLPRAGMVRRGTSGGQGNDPPAGRGAVRIGTPPGSKPQRGPPAPACIKASVLRGLLRGPRLGVPLAPGGVGVTGVNACTGAGPTSAARSTPAGGTRQGGCDGQVRTRIVFPPERYRGGRSGVRASGTSTPNHRHRPRSEGLCSHNQGPPGQPAPGGQPCGVPRPGRRLDVAAQAAWG